MPFLRFAKVSEKRSLVSIVAVAQATIGLGLGLWLSDKLQPHTRKKASWSLLFFGTTALLPVVMDLVYQLMNRPQSSRSMRRRLNSIRRNIGYAGDDTIY